MIYEIISKNDVPTTQMHIYLKNKTGEDGGIFPEIFNDLALTESVNGLYAFAVACVVTNNFTDMTKFLKDYPSKEIAVLAFIQYLKGLATTVQLKNKCVNPLYANLHAINQLGNSPSLLNLDGDLIYKHYDKTKYFSKEAADEAEDSFPYWVINTVKEIKTCTEIFQPSIKTYELPYYVQNISDERIPITNAPSTPIFENVIGSLPSTGTEVVVEIVNGYGKLASSENAYIFLSDKVRPFKHMVTSDELDSDVGSLKFPDNEFDIVCKNDGTVGRHGINSHYNTHYKFIFKRGDVVHIKKIFHNYGIIADGVYIPLHSNDVFIKIPTEDHTKDETNQEVINEITVDDMHAFDDCEFLVIIPASNEETARLIIKNILTKNRYSDAYIDIDLDNKFTVVVHGDNDASNAIRVKKKILSMHGYKASVVKYSSFYK